MNKTQEALKLALEALESGKNHGVAIDVLRRALADHIGDANKMAEHPAPPPECKTDAEKTAFAFGWWKALEENRKQPAGKPWVGLVWGELPEDGHNHDFLRGAAWAETMLREKNA